MAIEHSVSLPVPPGVFDPDGDILQDPALLKDLLTRLVRGITPRLSTVHLSLPGTLLRMVEMPRMDPSGLYMSLSSEAERYKTFDNTDAVVDFSPVHKENPASGGPQQVVFGAVRSDTLGYYLKILKDLKIKVASISLEPLCILKAMAGTGVLDGMVQQIGTEASWGVIFVEPDRVRLSLWQCDRLIALRETMMDTRDFINATDQAIAAEDLMEEIRRTTRTIQPAIWLSHGLPPAMQQVLGEKTGCPIHTTPIGQALAMQQPLQLSTIGAALSSMVQFPFAFNLLSGLAQLGRAAPDVAAAMSAEAAPAGEGRSLIPLGVGALVLGGLASAGLFIAATISAQQIPALESRRDGAKLEVGALQFRHLELQRRVELDQALLAMIQTSKIRNRVYVALLHDLQEKTPERIWIQSMAVSDALELKGKALSHQSVMNFARSFDQPVYSRNITIKSIREGRIGGARVFDFTILGGIHPDPSMAEAGAMQAEHENQTKEAHPPS